MFKNRTRLDNSFHFKDRLLKDLTSGVVYKFHCALCSESYYDECVRRLNVRIGEHVHISPIIKKKLSLRTTLIYYGDHLLGDHLLFCNHSASYDDFSILIRENKKFLLELKENLLKIRD